MGLYCRITAVFEVCVVTEDANSVKLEVYGLCELWKQMII